MIHDPILYGSDVFVLSNKTCPDSLLSTEAGREQAVFPEFPSMVEGLAFFTFARDSLGLH